MLKNLRQMKHEFLQHWKHYVFQSLFFTFLMFIVLVFLTLENAVVAASVGSSAFVVFAMPNSVPAKPRNLIGGQIVGMACGALGSFLAVIMPGSSLLFYSVAVGLSIFIMVVTDTEHPPASGTALGVAISSFSWNVALGVITACIFLSVVHVAARKHIRDLV